MVNVLSLYFNHHHPFPYVSVSSLWLPSQSSSSSIMSLILIIIIMDHNKQHDILTRECFFWRRWYTSSLAGIPLLDAIWMGGNLHYLPFFFSQKYSPTCMSTTITYHPANTQIIGTCKPQTSIELERSNNSHWHQHYSLWPRKTPDIPWSVFRLLRVPGRGLSFLQSSERWGWL